MGTAGAPDGWTSLLLLERFRDGDDRAAESLFARYFGRLTALARGRLSARLARRADPDEIALSALGSFFLKARAGRFVLGRVGDLWRLLSAIAVRKLLKRARRERAARRSFEAETPIDGVAEGRFVGRSPEPTPEEAVALAWVMARLDPIGRRVLELRLQGRPVSEIAADSGRSVRSVGRALAEVRDLLTARRDDSGLDVPTLSDRDFVLRRWIGAGRFGKVYEARPRLGGPDVAVKFLRRSLLDHPTAVRRFLDEARTAARLRHPNIVATEGLGRTRGGSYFLVMERLAGPDLAAHSGGRPVAEAEAVAWALDVCAALDHAHDRGVVHCDLKPANLVLDGSGRVKVTDFGLARSLAARPVGWATIEGTAPFMAPEQAGRVWGPIGRRTDLHGLGAVLFTLLTGRPPFVGRRLDDILDAVRSPKPAISPARLRPDLSPPLVAICLRCLAKPPAAHYRDIREVRSALQGL